MEVLWLVSVAADSPALECLSHRHSQAGPAPMKGKDGERERETFLPFTGFMLTCWALCCYTVIQLNTAFWCSNIVYKFSFLYMYIYTVKLSEHIYFIYIMYTYIVCVFV